MTAPSPQVASPTLRIAQLILERKDIDIRTWLTDKRETGSSFDDIAHQIYVLTDQEISVTYQTIRRWLVDLGIVEEATE